MKPINTPTIPVKEAVARVTLFRAQLIDQMPKSNIPRAILIPIDDLLAIIEKHSRITGEGKVVNTLKGVRAYFATKASDMDLPDDVTALIVAVDQEGNDIVVNQNKLKDDGDDEESEVYDFTLPCPSECDVESPLYVGE